jgi:elongation factor P
MDPGNYEQVSIPAALVGPQAAFLQPEMRVPVEFLQDRPVAVLMPEMLEVKIADTAPPQHNQQDSAWKPANLENGAVVMVPQFIKAGDSIRLELQSLKYMDRVKTAQKGS